MQESNSPINWQEILKITNHRPELAKEMVGMLAGELPEMKRLIEGALKTKNQTDLLNHVHKLHGSCCYCGVSKLRQLSAQIEKHLKISQVLSNDQYTSVLHPLFRDLFDEIDVILNYINQQAITL